MSIMCPNTCINSIFRYEHVQTHGELAETHRSGWEVQRCFYISVLRAQLSPRQQLRLARLSLESRTRT